MKALEILKSATRSPYEDDEFIMYPTIQDTEEAISELEALQQHVKELEDFEERSCMRCKNVNDCSLCENVKADTGIKLREMSFFCFQKKDKQ